jgi:signal transduction histidine kinase
MLEGLLELARIGRAEIPPTSVSLGEAAAAAAEHQSSRFREAGGGIAIAPLLSSHGDFHLWQRVFELLFDNAWRYRGDRPPQVTIAAGPASGRIAVTDSGIGIAAEFRERIFEPFQRLHGRDSVPGVGLGLTIARKIVGRHGGRLTVEAEPAGGSRFVIELAPSRHDDHAD